MASPRRSRPQGDGDTLIAEFTSGQLVVGICVALFVALTCFLAGVLLGRYDSTLAATETAQAAPPGEGTQLSPRPDVLSTVPTAPASPFTTPEERAAGPRTVAVAPPPANATPAAPVKIERTGGNGLTERPVSIVNPEPPAPRSGDRTPPPPPPPRGATPTPTETPDKAPAKEERRVVLADLDPHDEDLDALLEKPAPPKAAEPKPAPPAPAAKPARPAAPVTEKAPAAPPAPKPAANVAASGGYVIQVASFMGADRQKRAEDAREKYASGSGMPAQVVPSADGSIHRVLIVGFKDKSAADAACSQLRTKKGFKDAFVKELGR